VSRLGLVLAVALGCQTADGGGRSEPQRSKDPSEKDYVGPQLPTATVVLQDAFGGRHAVQVEVAATEASRRRGLMWRERLEPGRGMLFAFPEDDVQSFWMKNTLIPLDLLFIDAQGKVVGIVADAKPHTLSPRTVGKPSRYVLEVPGGWTADKGIVPGGQVELRGLGQVRVE
jgi:uncharacterized protein